MDTDERGFPMKQITEQVIGAAYRVSNELGVGFLEKVYENALKHELTKAGLQVEQQVPLSVVYDSVLVGEYFVDLLVQDELVVELKHARSLDNAHLAQCLNYLKVTRKRLALLLNFGTPRVEVKRIANNY